MLLLSNFRIGQCGGRLRQILGHIARHALTAFGEHSNSGADLAGRAVTALKAVMFDKGCLHGMQVVAQRKPLDHGDGLAVMHHRKRTRQTYAVVVMLALPDKVGLLLEALTRNRGKIWIEGKLFRSTIAFTPEGRPTALMSQQVKTVASCCAHDVGK
jgi:hypothetical protein